MASVLNQPYFHDEEAAFVALEAIMWPQGKPEHCPHCGVVGKANRLAVQRSKPSKRNPNGKPVYGLWKCYACRKQFTVRKGTIFEESRLELHLWFQAAFLMCSSKKGVSANQLHRTLGCTLKTAWFVAHRLREAMAEGLLSPFGKNGGAVEADEAYIGRWRRKGENERGGDHKMKVLTLIDRETRKAHSTVMVHINTKTVGEVVAANVSREARLMTDQATYYNPIGKLMADHQSVNHSKDEYVRGEAYTNNAEGYFSLFKKGMKAIYQHCDEKHLHRYLAEFDFRYNHRAAQGVNDLDRAAIALQGAKGKRLLYRDSLL
ncbi:MAG: IS1595 family transposase [Alphaproteobacteria bacterium]|nr:IS1595 family transposase [Alphaproteobacteria bacterium]